MLDAVAALAGDLLDAAPAALVDGRLLAGGTGQAGEIGHLRPRPDGPACGGLAAAGRALLEPRERATVQRVPEPRLTELGERAGVLGAALAAREAAGGGPR